MREDIIGRANVDATPELQAYYGALEKHETGALWTVANDIEPWQPKSKSIPVSTSSPSSSSDSSKFSVSQVTDRLYRGGQPTEPLGGFLPPAAGQLHPAHPGQPLQSHA